MVDAMELLCVLNENALTSPVGNLLLLTYDRVGRSVRRSIGFDGEKKSQKMLQMCAGVGFLARNRYWALCAC